MQQFVLYTVPAKGILTFLLADQIISCQNTISVLTAQELLDACRTVEDSVVGMQFGTVAYAAGKTDLSASIQVGITVTLLENWTIYSQKTSGSFTIQDGNIVRWDATTPFYPNTLCTYQQILIQGGVITTVSGGSGLSPSESAKLMGLPSATDVATETWNTQTSTITAIGRFGKWVKELLAKTFFVGYS